MSTDAPLIAHVLHRFDIGGLENGVVNLINRIPPDRYRHAIISMTDYSPDFARRLTNPAVSLHSIHKKDGKDPAAFLRLWRMLRSLRPSIVHSRNLSAVEASVVAAFAGVPARVHGEHGRDIHDIDGLNKKYLMLRRLCQPFIQRYICVSKDLEQWLLNTVAIPAHKVRQVYNGVDRERFQPLAQSARAVLPPAFTQASVVIGTVGRLQTVKDQLTLVRAFAEVLKQLDAESIKPCLVIVGDGPLRSDVEGLIAELKLNDFIWLAGARDDVPQLMQAMDLFVLPSQAEGISNTILESMACGLPVVATAVGGNVELVIPGKTGALVPANKPQAMAETLVSYVRDQQMLREHGQAGRQRIMDEFSMEAMVSRYLAVYDELRP